MSHEAIFVCVLAVAGLLWWQSRQASSGDHRGDAPPTGEEKAPKVRTPPLETYNGHQGRWIGNTFVYADGEQARNLVDAALRVTQRDGERRV